jgi:hypothetical protein
VLYRGCVWGEFGCSGYVVRTLDGLHEIGTFSRRAQAEQACHVAAAFAAMEQERLDELSAANG